MYEFAFQYLYMKIGIWAWIRNLGLMLKVQSLEFRICDSEIND